MELICLRDLLGRPKSQARGKRHLDGRGFIRHHEPPLTPRYPLGRSSLYNEIASGKFVPPIRFGNRASRWIGEEVDAVMTARAAGIHGDELNALVQGLVKIRRSHDAQARRQDLLRDYLGRPQ